MEMLEKWVQKRERYRDSVQKPEATSNDANEFEQAPVAASAGLAQEPKAIPTEQEPEDLVPGSISIPPYSCMANLWREWQTGTSETSLDLRFTDGHVSLPFTPEELRTESAQCAFKLSAVAKGRDRMIRPAEGQAMAPAAAQPVLYVAQNQMAAWIMVFPPVAGGAPAKEEDLYKMLDAHGVCFGIDEDAVARIVKEQIYFRLVLVACGTLPGKSEDGYVEEFFPHSPSAPQTKEMRIAAMLNAKYLAKIEKGTKISHRVPAVQGVHGKTVGNADIPAKPAKEASLILGKNIEIVDGDTLVAAVEGYLYYEDGRFNVQQTLTVENGLDANSELIDFDGDVWIMGDVLNMNIIRASGAVIVTGSVENSFIQAGGSIVICSGVVGEDEGTIRAGESVYAKFLERCTVYAGKMIRCECSICSHLYSNGSISITEGRGVVVGGSLTAADRIEANVIGSQSERNTEITLGEYPCHKKDREALQLQIDNIKTEIEALHDALPQNTEYSENEDESSNMIAQSKHRLRLASLMLKKQRLEKKMNSLQSHVSDYSKCRLHCAKIFPKTSMIICTARFLTQDEYSDCTFELVGDKIRAFRNS